MRITRVAVAAASVLALVACTPSESSTTSTPGTPLPTQATSVGGLGCSPEDVNVEWKLPTPSARTLTRVYVQLRDSKGSIETSTHDLVPSVAPAVTPPELADRLDWLTQSLNEAGEPAESAPGPLMPTADEMFADINKPGKFVAYGGADKVDAAFTLSCPNGDRTQSGVLHTWMKPVVGILDCVITPPAQSYGAMVRSYCK